MRLTVEQKWQATLRWLRRNFPLPSPVDVRSIEMKDHGEASYDSGRKLFSIRINKKKSLSSRIDTVIHEWAHALSWFGSESEIEDHSSEFGIVWAKIYRNWLEWDYGRAKKKIFIPLRNQTEFDF